MSLANVFILFNIETVAGTGHVWLSGSYQVGSHTTEMDYVKYTSDFKVLIWKTM